MPRRCVIYIPLLLYSHRCVRLCRIIWLYGAEDVYTYPAWGFGVARFDRQGNSQEPQDVKRATVQGFTLFLCLNGSA